VSAAGACQRQHDIAERRITCHQVFLPITWAQYVQLKVAWLLGCCPFRAEITER